MRTSGISLLEAWSPFKHPRDKDGKWRKVAMGAGVGAIISGTAGVKIAGKVAEYKPRVDISLIRGELNKVANKTNIALAAMLVNDSKQRFPIPDPGGKSAVEVKLIRDKFVAIKLKHERTRLRSLMYAELRGKKPQLQPDRLTGKELFSEHKNIEQNLRKAIKKIKLRSKLAKSLLRSKPVVGITGALVGFGVTAAVITAALAVKGTTTRKKPRFKANTFKEFDKEMRKRVRTRL